jgi:hypothetical protein
MRTASSSAATYCRPENSAKRLAPAFTVQPPRINAA